MGVFRLGIDGPQRTERCHDNLVSPHCQNSAGALGAMRNQNRELGCVLADERATIAKGLLPPRPPNRARVDLLLLAHCLELVIKRKNRTVCNLSNRG